MHHQLPLARLCRLLRSRMGLNKILVKESVEKALFHTPQFHWGFQFPPKNHFLFFMIQGNLDSVSFQTPKIIFLPDFSSIVPSPRIKNGHDKDYGEDICTTIFAPTIPKMIPALDLNLHFSDQIIPSVAQEANFWGQNIFHSVVLLAFGMNFNSSPISTRVVAADSKSSKCLSV